VPESAPKVDAIVLAGTHLDRRKLIAGLNKAFLPLGSRVCLDYLLEALSRARRVDRIFVVGPEEELRRRVPPERWGHRIVPETGRMLDNAWKGFRAAEGLRPEIGSPEREKRPHLFLTSDIPLAVPEAVDDFVERCFAREAETGEIVDFFPGVADEVALAPFYPRPPRRGIRRPYMETKCRRLRLANIYMVRPHRIRNLEILQQGFTARKLTQWRSIARLIRTFLENPGGIRGACHVASFQAVTVLDRGGLTWLSSLARESLHLPVIERTASMMLGCRFAAVVTPYGGLSLDIDEELDYEIIQENLIAWREHQRTLLPEPLLPGDTSEKEESAAAAFDGPAPTPSSPSSGKPNP